MYILKYPRVFLIFFFTIALCILSYRILELFSYLPTLSFISSGLIIFNAFDVFRDFIIIRKFRLFLKKGLIIDLYQLSINIIFYVQKAFGYLVFLRFKSKATAKNAASYIISLKISGILILMSLYFHLLTVVKITACIIIALQGLSDMQLLGGLKLKCMELYLKLDEIFTTSLENSEKAIAEENEMLNVNFHEQNENIDPEEIFGEYDESELSYLKTFFTKPSDDTDDSNASQSDGNSIFDDESILSSTSDFELEIPSTASKLSKHKRQNELKRAEFFSLLQQTEAQKKKKVVSNKKPPSNSDSDGDFVLIKK